MFVSEELEEKRGKIRKLLDELGLDAILIKKIHNFAWMTGGGINYVGITTETGICPLLITRDGSYVISSRIEAPRLKEEELMEEKGYRQLVYPWHNDRGEAEAVADIVKGGKLGSDCGHPGSTDVNQRINLLRWSLTKWEIDRYRELGRTTSQAIEETCKTVRSGEKECEVTSRLLAALWALRIDYVNTFCAADDRIGKFRHPLSTERRIDKRMMLCVNSRKHGLIISLSRFIQFGKTSGEIRKIYNDNVRIDCLMMAATIPGRPIVEPFIKGVEEYKRLGYDGEYELHHQGGPIGYVGREMRVHWGTEGAIAENQAYSWNPSITGSKSEDVMLATSGGPQPISLPVVFPKMELEVGGRHFVRPDILEL